MLGLALCDVQLVSLPFLPVWVLPLGLCTHDLGLGTAGGLVSVEALTAQMPPVSKLHVSRGQQKQWAGGAGVRHSLSLVQTLPGLLDLEPVLGPVVAKARHAVLPRLVLDAVVPLSAIERGVGVLLVPAGARGVADGVVVERLVLDDEGDEAGERHRLLPRGFLRFEDGDRDAVGKVGHGPVLGHKRPLLARAVGVWRGAVLGVAGEEEAADDGGGGVGAGYAQEGGEEEEL